MLRVACLEQAAAAVEGRRHACHVGLQDPQPLYANCPAAFPLWLLLSCFLPKARWQGRDIYSNFAVVGLLLLSIFTLSGRIHSILPIHRGERDTTFFAYESLLLLGHELDTSTRIVEETETSLDVLDADFLCSSLLCQ